MSAVVAVVGAGPAGLIAAETLARAGVRVVVFDHMASAGRKFLLAGRGGLNLTHSEDLELFLTRYRPWSPLLTGAIRSFPPDALRAWADELGQTTFVGTSGRVFPAGFRATPLLRAWLARLAALGVEFRLRHRWVDWPVVVSGPDGATMPFEADALILAAGGASWPRTGSDGGWVLPLASAGVPVTRLRPANAGFAVDWSPEFRTRFAGTPLKDVALTFAGSTSRGDAVVTDAGIEGGVVYAIGADVRTHTEEAGPAQVSVDLRPDSEAEQLTMRLARRRPKESVAGWLRRAGFAPVEISLLREATGNAIPADPRSLAALVKEVALPVNGLAPIGRAISTAGGVAFDALDERFMLRERPGTFVAGEMLDWEAPTGGYLLQGCFSTGVAAGQGAVDWLSQRS